MEPHLIFTKIQKIWVKDKIKSDGPGEWGGGGGAFTNEWKTSTFLWFSFLRFPARNNSRNMSQFLKIKYRQSGGWGWIHRNVRGSLWQKGTNSLNKVKRCFVIIFRWTRQVHFLEMFFGNYVETEEKQRKCFKQNCKTRRMQIIKYPVQDFLMSYNLFLLEALAVDRWPAIKYFLLRFF